MWIHSFLLGGELEGAQNLLVWNVVFRIVPVGGDSSAAAALSKGLV